MIFVTLGTFDMPFNRLLEYVDKLIESGKIVEEVIVQAGFTKYNSNNFKIIDFLSNEEIEQYYNNSSFIISHGGTGSLMLGVKKGKKVIGVPRLAKYGEHNNDHQIEIINLLKEQNFILSAFDYDELSMAIDKIQYFEPKKYVSKTQVIIDFISDYIDSF
ncbi:PssE/Cps14G family polysaccharide biosynthesis glycosyltransferase [Thermobrachium celere]|uniref:PssE/Cps14G family polysaccharide biosynthesis glycosyltransferase n=1 Tax=Thermobrachium celere TaxID=53422 RepID=UPI0019406B7A|nr:PssE/Cps14G family polysaccharide biosynthesis glycosyltransferase [Thermobrachium celere]GFR36231.1 hypothetical protein TCEA9_20430 [Thermobrachium celere]